MKMELPKQNEAVSASVVTLAPVLVITGIGMVTAAGDNIETKIIGVALIMIGMSAGLYREKIKPAQN